MLGVLVIGVLFVLRPDRRPLPGHRRRLQPGWWPIGRPGYGYGGGGYGGPGGGGGGFFSSLFGGIGGAMAGNWIYDQFSGRHQGGGSVENASYDPPAQRPPIRRSNRARTRGAAAAPAATGAATMEPPAAVAATGAAAATPAGGDWGGAAATGAGAATPVAAPAASGEPATGDGHARRAGSDCEDRNQPASLTRSDARLPPWAPSPSRS